MDSQDRSQKSPRSLLPLRDSVRRSGELRLRPSENHLYFDVVARHGSIRKAADALHIASSALNRRILDLEDEVGSPLFERLPRGVRLTAAGEMFLSYVRSSLKELQKVEAQLDQLRGKMRGTVRIAVAESVTPSLLPEAIDNYQKAHPGVEFHVQVDGPELLMGALLRDSVDLILTHERPSKTGVIVLAVAAHPLCALVAPEHPLARKKQLQLSECAPFPLAMPDRTLAARSVLDRAMEETSLPLRAVVESDSIETLKAFARRGNAVCFSFHLGRAEEAHGLLPLAITDSHCADARLYLAARRTRVLPVAAASFAEELASTLQQAVIARPVSVA